MTRKRFEVKNVIVLKNGLPWTLEMSEIPDNVNIVFDKINGRLWVELLEDSK